MSLFLNLTTHPIDEGYLEAAKRRAASGQDSRRTGRATAVMVVLALALAGTLFATSAVATHRGAAAAKHDRKQLLVQIRQQAATSDQLQRELDRLRAEVENARNGALSASDRGAALQAEIQELEITSGSEPVEGQGVEVTLDNAKDVSNADSASLGTIYDRDIQAVVDALFASGAEAIAVNGQRLTTRTAIREAGQAILVDYRPLSPPYVVDAIGPPDLKQIFLRTQTGELYQNWRQVYGLGFSVADRSRLTLPSAANQVVHYAQPLESP